MNHVSHVHQTQADATAERGHNSRVSQIQLCVLNGSLRSSNSRLVRGNGAPSLIRSGFLSIKLLPGDYLRIEELLITLGVGLGVSQRCLILLEVTFGLGQIALSLGKCHL